MPKLESYSTLKFLRKSSKKPISSNLCFNVTVPQCSFLIPKLLSVRIEFLDCKNNSTVLPFLAAIHLLAISTKSFMLLIAPQQEFDSYHEISVVFKNSLDGGNSLVFIYFFLVYWFSMFTWDGFAVQTLRSLIPTKTIIVNVSKFRFAHYINCVIVAVGKLVLRCFFLLRFSSF